MTLTQEQIKELKSQLKKQVESLPEEQKTQALKEIDSMTPEVLESWLKQQQSQSSGSGEGGDQPVYRSIVSGEIPAKTIGQNSEAIAVLEIKPISKGHTIIIPKKPIKNAKDLPDSAFTLAKETASRIEPILEASGTEIQTQFMFGEIIINVIPIYDQSLNVNSPRQNAKPEELDKLYSKLKTPKKLQVIKKETKKPEKVVKMKRRMP